MAAQVTVDAASYSLEVANLALEAAHVALYAAEGTLEATNVALEGVKQANAFGAEILSEIATWTLGNLLNIESLEFDVKLSVAESGSFSGSMTATILGINSSFSFGVEVMSVSDMVDELLEIV